MSSRVQLVLLVIASNIYGSYGLQCYDCYGTGPDHKECTVDRNCNGVACMIFDAGDNHTASAFCLLAMRDSKIDEAKDGCWLEPDGKGKHCMCFSDFCNKLVDRRNTDEADPMAPLLPTAEFLKQNPLVEYDSPNLGDYVDDGAHPPPQHILFPSAAKQDPKTAGAADDDDLVPVEFEDYKDTAADIGEAEEMVPLPHDKEDEEDVKNMKPKNTTVVENEDEVKHDSENEISGGFVPPAWIVFLFPMAASWARFFAGF